MYKPSSKEVCLFLNSGNNYEKGTYCYSYDSPIGVYHVYKKECDNEVGYTYETSQECMLYVGNKLGIYKNSTNSSFSITI